VTSAYGGDLDGGRRHRDRGAGRPPGEGGYVAEEGAAEVPYELRWSLG
jgi:hypothetical protein